MAEVCVGMTVRRESGRGVLHGEVVRVVGSAPTERGWLVHAAFDGVVLEHLVPASRAEKAVA